MILLVLYETTDYYHWTGTEYRELFYICHTFGGSTPFIKQYCLYGLIPQRMKYKEPEHNQRATSVKSV